MSREDNIYGLYVAVRRNFLKEEIVGVVSTHELNTAKGLTESQSSNSSVVITDGRGIRLDLCVDSGGGSAGALVIALGEDNGGDFVIKVLGPKRRKGLNTVSTEELDSILLGEADGEDTRGRGGVDAAEVESVGENGPVVVDGTVVSISRVGKAAMVAKLVADIDISTGLIAVSIVGGCRIPPVTVLGLVADLREGKLSLAVDLVVRNVTAGVVVPLNKSGAVTRNPFCLELESASSYSLEYVEILSSKSLPAEISVYRETLWLLPSNETTSTLR